MELELCPKCGTDYLKLTQDRRKLICHFCGQTKSNLYLKHKTK